MGQTPRFGFDLHPDGDMIFGKDLNKAIENIEEKLWMALYMDKVQDEGIVTGFTAVGLAADDVYEAVAFDSARKIMFARQADLSKVRVIFTKTGGSTGTLSVSVGKTGGILPLTGDIDFTDSGDQSVDPSAATRLAANEELDLLAKRTTGCDLAGTIQVVVEGDVVFSGEI
jgi:hypothetical protein